MSETNSGTIGVHVVPQPNGSWVCTMTSSFAGRERATKSVHGQSPNHAIALALEGVALAFRREAEAEQNVDPEAVDRSPSGEIINKRFHVILHYEDVAEEESKFEAMANTLLGNTVIENAEVSIIQIDPGLPEPEWVSRIDESDRPN